MAVAGCGGGDDSAGTTTAIPGPTGTAPARTVRTSATPAPGETLLRFVKAAGRGDAATMWSLLTPATQASIGPTLAGFRGGAAREFSAGLGTLAPQAKVILSQRVGRWGVAAVAGERSVKGKAEYFAYGAALQPELGAWRLELGGVIISGLEPEPLARIDEERPTVGAGIGAAAELDEIALWVDGERLPATPATDSPFTAKLAEQPAQALEPGRHEVVVFGGTIDTASASAWTFTVE
ncbi:MAG: hypothetical protein H0V40_01095 [Actinobacteria bacterium]|nr:hypothetical protein [Actinomycetota bacterium]